MRKLELIKEGFSSIPNVTSGSLMYLDSRNVSSYPGSGTTWFDLSGNGNNATLVNGVSYNATSKSLVFDGTNDYVQTPVNYSLGTGAVNDFTVTVYFNTVTRSASSGSSRLLISNAKGTPIPFNVYVNTSTGTALCISRGSSGTVVLNSTTVIDDGNWHTVTYRKIGNVYSVFVDGVFENSTTVNIGNCNVTNNFTLGVLANLLNQGFYKDNYASFLLYTSGLSDAQILNNKKSLFRENTGTPLETFEFDLYDDEPISVTKQGIDVNNLTERSSGITNSFKLPLTANNNSILEHLQVEGNLTNKPYEINYVRYTQDSTELISKGRLNINGIDSDGYDVDIIHGINSFFDLIRGKFLYEAYEPFRTTLTEMVATQTTLTNDLTVNNNEGYIVSLMDLGNINPIPEYQQQISYFLDFGIEKIADAVGYSLTNTDVDLNELVFTPKDVPVFDSIKKQFAGEIEFLGAGKDFKFFSYVLEKNSYLYFDFQLVQQLTTITDNPRIEVRVDSVVVFSDIVVDGVIPYINSFDSTPNIYEQGSLVEIYMTSTTTYGAVQGRFYDYKCLGLFDNNFEVYHENFLKDYTQEDFIKSIRQLKNIGFNIDDIFKTIEIFSLNNVFDSSYGNIIDLSDYFDKVLSKTFANDYGKNNTFTYTYQDNTPPFADGILIANNYNKDKTLLESELTPSLNNTEFTLGTDTVYLTTAKSYEDATVQSKTEDIGNRINKVLRYDTSVGNPVTVDYINVLGTPSTINSNQSILSFTGLDWQTLIEENYSNIRDKVLNRYAQYKVSMNVPFYIIKDFDIKDKVFIDSLGANFVVQEIKTLPDGLSEWTLIKLNEI